MSATRVIIKNLPLSCDEPELKHHVSSISQGSLYLTDCKVIRTADGKSRMFAFVGVKTPEAAMEVVQKLNGTFLNTRKLEVKLADAKGSSERSERPWSKYSEGSSTYQKIHLNDSTKSSDSKKKENAGKDEKSAEVQEETDVKNKKKRKSASGVEGEAENLPKAETKKNKNKKSRLNAATEGSNPDVETPCLSGHEVENEGKSNDDEYRKSVELCMKTRRVRVINIAYSATADEVENFFSSNFGEVQTVHMTSSNDGSLLNQGYCFVTFRHAENALESLGDTTFQGRLIRVDSAHSENEKTVISPDAKVMSHKKRLTVRSQLEEAKKQRARHPASWNLLFTSANASLDAVSAQLGIEKSSLMDIWETKDSLAARQAIAETLVLSQTREWLVSEGLRMDAFIRTGLDLLTANAAASEEPAANSRSKDTLIVKHLSLDIDITDLRNMFQKFGLLTRFAVSPSKTVAVVKFLDSVCAKKAYANLALKRMGSSVLMLEWAPENIFSDSTKTDESLDSQKDLKGSSPAQPSPEVFRAAVAEVDREENEVSTSVFVKNLNFETTEETISKLFGKMPGYRSSKIMMKKRSGESQSTAPLSLGFGFVEFKTKPDAIACIKALDNVSCDGHALQLQISHGNRKSQPKNTGADSEAKETQNENSQIDSPDVSNVQKKLVVFNLPFEVKAQDIRQLFSAFVSVSSIRLPKKNDGSIRGYAFVEFHSRSDAVKALETLQHTHLLGRHLVIEAPKQ